MVQQKDRFPRQYDLCFGKRPLEELYDVRNDPWQIRNLADDAQFADVKQRLWSQLKTRLRSSGDPRIKGEDPWTDYAYRQTIGFGATFNLTLSEVERRLARERASHKPE